MVTIIDSYHILRNRNKNKSFILFLLFYHVLMLSSIYTSCTWLPLKTFCCPPSLHSSLAENRGQLSGQEQSVCLAQEESRDWNRVSWGPWIYLKAAVVSRQAALPCAPKESFLSGGSTRSCTKQSQWPSLRLSTGICQELKQFHENRIFWQTAVTVSAWFSRSFFEEHCGSCVNMMQ